jgi:hypothetical protein
MPWISIATCGSQRGKGTETHVVVMEASADTPCCSAADFKQN